MIKAIKDALQKIWCINIKHTRKNSHQTFYIKNFIRYAIPRWVTQGQLNKRLQEFYKLPREERNYILERVNYYCRFEDEIFIPHDAQALNAFKYRKRESYVHDYVNSMYFFDAYNYTRYFPVTLRWAYNPGDVNYLFPVPEITKSRPISTDEGNRNNILLNLDKIRHFTWVYDPFKWEDKELRIIFRGDTTNKPHRTRFIEMWKDHPWCDLANTGGMALYDHLRYKYIMALEGNDVASNLKWVMSSNSVAVMPRPKFETWYMEGKLIPNYHYIEIAADYSDLIERISYYEEHPKEAKAITEHAHEWVKQFRNKKREDLISLMVLEKYFRLTKQWHTKISEPACYVVNDLVKLNTSQKMNAQGKAREDVCHTLNRLGFSISYIINHKYSLGEDKRYHHYPFFSDYLAKRQALRIASTIKHDDVVLIQDFQNKHMQILTHECTKRGAKVIFLIHDVQCIRFDIATDEVNQLNNASLLLVHTEAMKEKLERLGVTTPMHVITLFDYYSNDPMQSEYEVNTKKNIVVFAGNLTKSDFLKNFVESNCLQDTVMNLYGVVGNMDFSKGSNFRYCGVFTPEHTGKINGGWGLVWDGWSIDSCEGDYGGYLKYNSSHKISLYLACGMPLILWSQSSLAEWVKKENIGITIDNLRELDSILGSITPEEHRKMIKNVRKIGKKLRKGKFLEYAIRETK